MDIDISSLLAAAERARLAGDYEQGIDLAQRAANLADRHSDDVSQARAQSLLGNQLTKLGEYEPAVKACELAITLLEAIGDEAGICESITFQAQAYSFLGLQEEAVDSLNTGLEVAQRLGDQLLLFWMSNRIGALHCDMAEWAAAEPFLLHAYGLSTGNDLGSEATFCILNNLASLAGGYVKELRAGGDTRGADDRLEAGLDYAQQAVMAARSATHPYREAISLGNHAMLLALAGDFAGADARNARSLEISVTHSYPPLELEGLKDAAEILLMRGDLPAAVSRLNQVLELAREINEPYVVLDVHEKLSAAYQGVGDFEAALRHFRDYHRIERQLHTEVANRRAKMLTHRFELHQAKLEADKARLAARLATLRSHGLEAEKQALEIRATELGRHANEDPLTGLWNRRHMDDQFPELLQRAHDNDQPLCVAIGDVDRFKEVNDEFGHAVGDQVLQHLAALLRSGCRPRDMVARMGGEEFFFAFIDTAFVDAQATCERLRRAVEDYGWASVQPGLDVTISFGLGESAGANDSHQLLARADSSLYAAKRSGRNRVEPPIDHHLDIRRNLSATDDRPSVTMR